jgi:[ribosomal protein S5]-alanine N-acetyltransferase
MPNRFPAPRALSLNCPLSTERLSITPLLGADAAPMFEPLQADALYAWISTEPPTSVAALAARWQRNESRLAPDGSTAWLGWAVRAGDVIVGKLDAEIDTRRVATNVGYLVFVDHWGKGFATEALSAISDHLARSGVVEQHASVTVGNVASCRVLEKAGFVQNGVLPANDTIRGVACDDFAYVRRARQR